MSSLFRKRRLTMSSTGTGPTSSKKQRLIDITRVLLDVAKESSDWFPPLKSCLGGINALIKHYDEIQDVKDKLEDLVLWVTKLRDSLANPDTSGDLEEGERRMQLTKSLDDIEKRSQALLGKRKMGRALDKTQDTQAVIRLVDQLQKTILVYQMSQQQSVHNQVMQLTTSFGVFLKLEKKTPEATRKIEGILARLDKFQVMVNDTGSGDISKHHAVLFEALEGIKDELLAISNNYNTPAYQRNKADIHAVCELAQVLKDVIVEYQFAQQKAIYDQNCRLIDAAELLVLNTCPHAHGAGYQHGDRQGCLSGTREAILDGIESWTKDFHESPIYWLNGLAGTGKSTIAQTTAEHLFADGWLGASFFCSRDFKDRSNLHLIFPTLSFQLAHRYPGFRSILIPFLQSNPEIGYESLHSQMERLIVTPLKEANISTVVVIDALDECTDDEPQSAILSVMGRFVEEIPNVKFFITGRPEPCIQSGFRLKLLRPLTEIFTLHMVEHSIVNVDIQRFLKTQLSELAQRFQMTGWPSDAHIDLLCQRAAGLFIYADATIKFLDHKIYPPQQRLDVIVNLPECTSYEGAARLKVNTTLDSLYTSILQMALDFGTEDPNADSRVQSIIGTVVLAVNPLPPSAIAELIGLEAEQVMMVLKLVQSLLILSEDPTHPVKPFHKSFPDFITDPSRCLNKRFYISPGALQCELAVHCLRLMNDTLKQNLLSLPDCALNQEVRELSDKVKEHISSALEYACKSWCNHLTRTRENITCILDALHMFLKKRFLAWLEVISVLGAARNAVDAMENLMLWLQEVGGDQELLDTAKDYFQFVTKFFEVIKVSAPHIYHSALELSPKSSIIQRHYHCQLFQDPKTRVVYGTPNSWNQPTGIKGRFGSCAWSPCGQFFAVQRSHFVEVWDALTIEKCSDLQRAKPHLDPPLGINYRSLDMLAYSPDGHSLAGCFGDVITIWDIQTGGVTEEIEHGVKNALPRLLAWSLDGTIICATFPAGETWTVVACDVTSGKVACTTTFQSLIKPHLWSLKNTLQAMIIQYTEYPWTPTIKIIKIWPISNDCIIETFPINIHKSLVSSPERYKSLTFSPSTYQLCNTLTNLSVIDIRNSEVLLEWSGYFSTGYFSPDGSLLVAHMADHVYIWKYTPEQGYSLWKMFRSWIIHDPPYCRVSPTSPSVLSVTAESLEVQHLNLATDPPTESTGHYDNISTNGTYVVVAPKFGSTVTIANLNEGSPWFLDTGFGIVGLTLTGDILLVKGFDRLSAWRLTAEGVVDMVLGDGGGDDNGELWTRAVGDNHLWVGADGGIGVIELSRGYTYYYDTKNGKELEPVPDNPLPSPQYWRFLCSCHDTDYPAWRHVSNYLFSDVKGHLLMIPPKVPVPCYREGWVEFPEGQHRRRFWLPGHWRPPWSDARWFDGITTLRLETISDLVIIKF